jgi:hypothetical protein
MLPLRSRTSWRLRALTVTCLPRDWTGAGVYHFANSRSRGHDLPEGHYGEPVEQAWATRHTRQSLGPADPRAAAGSSGPSDPRAFRSGRTPGRGRHYHVAGPAQRDPCGGGTGTTQISYGSSGAVSTTRASASPAAISSNSASLTRPRTILWPPRASSARSGPANLQALQEPESPPWAFRQAGMCGPDFRGPPASLTVNS